MRIKPTPNAIQITSFIFNEISFNRLAPNKCATIGVIANINPLSEKKSGFATEDPMATPDNSTAPARPATMVSVRPIAA